MTLDNQSDPRPPLPGQRSRTLTVIMMTVGVILLLPGLCTVLYAGMLLVNDAGNVIGEVLRGEPIMTMVLLFWVVCILISLFGVWLLRRARRARQA